MCHTSSTSEKKSYKIGIFRVIHLHYGDILALNLIAEQGAERKCVLGKFIGWQYILLWYFLQHVAHHGQSAHYPWIINLLTSRLDERWAA